MLSVGIPPSMVCPTQRRLSFAEYFDQVWLRSHYRAPLGACLFSGGLSAIAG